MKTSKELWPVFENKYKTKDARLNKFVAAKFLDYKMVDGKSVITQVQELQVIIHDLLAEGLFINEAFQVSALIEKLPPLWKDFKNYLKYKHKEMSLEDLIVRLRIKEEYNVAEKKVRGNSIIMGANIIEDAPKNTKKRKKPSGPNVNPSKKRFNGNWYNYGKVEYKSVDYRARKKDKKKGQANMVKKNEDIYDLCAMIFECKLVEILMEWWIDYGATRHVCVVSEAFATYATAGLEKTLSMRNSATTKIEGCGKIFLKLTSCKMAIVIGSLSSSSASNAQSSFEALVNSDAPDLSSNLSHLFDRLTCNCSMPASLNSGYV
uniref:Retrovirus-related Pol polyprotein from transposon TNT 1-94-like beta-barrel domain-containing protein n=1 Tax=Nicotiana tabacum TaxID=4097 RepID=A0A1S4CIH9_TOBAC|nr:PREDICTED: uncharacterized protein LOC107819231 [Nicotiana tabacum]